MILLVWLMEKRLCVTSAVVQILNNNIGFTSLWPRGKISWKCRRSTIRAKQKDTFSKQFFAQLCMVATETTISVHERNGKSVLRNTQFLISYKYWNLTDEEDPTFPNRYQHILYLLTRGNDFSVGKMAVKPRLRRGHKAAAVWQPADRAGYRKSQVDGAAQRMLWTCQVNTSKGERRVQ